MSFVAERLIMVRFLILLFVLSAYQSAAIAADDVVINDFEADTFGTWVVEGEAFGPGPVQGAVDGQMPVSGVLGKGVANSFSKGDQAVGTITSPEFVITHNHLAFLIGGGKIPDALGIELLADGQRVRSETGHESEGMKWESWDVSELKGRRVTLRIFDRATGGWGHILVDQIIQTDTSRHAITVDRLSSYRKSKYYYQEPFRPQFHFTPEMNWMNDPNGLVYYDGEYHLFYQHNPHANEWGHMSWGHAVSKDLVHWKHLPIALHDEYGVMAFSGSAVVDQENTSGFGVNGKPPMVAIYTGHSAGLQTQDIAFSNDRGRTWTKYEGNPVLDIGEADFRDPKVFWHSPSKRWVMVVTLAVQKKLQFYGSPNLKDWTLLSEFGPAGVPNKPNWECPDIFELPIENEPGRTRWVLEADMGGGAIAGGSGGEYFTGVFDGTSFVADSKESQWVDFGRDFYAPVSWSNIPASDGRRLWIGWMNNWETALNPTSPWRSAMSIPRELTLRRISGQLRLCQRPVRELQLLRTDSVRLKNVELKSETRNIGLRGQQLEVIAVFNPGDAREFGMRVLKGTNQETVVGYDVKSQSLFIDRIRSGNVDFHPAFPGRHRGPLIPDDSGQIRLHLFVDASSVEVFGNDGETVVTDLVFPDVGSAGAEVYSFDGTCNLVECEVYRLKSAVR
ncbi:MAG: glycoside hydrolase family 32 protein, partial [Planctomycetota bacterium]